MGKSWVKDFEEQERYHYRKYLDELCSKWGLSLKEAMRVAKTIEHHDIVDDSIYSVDKIRHRISTSATSYDWRQS